MSREANFSTVCFTLYDYSFDIAYVPFAITPKRSDGNVTVVLAKVVVADNSRRLLKLNMNVELNDACH